MAQLGTPFFCRIEKVRYAGSKNLQCLGQSQKHLLSFDRRYQGGGQ